jgi:hypothetical protein
MGEYADRDPVYLDDKGGHYCRHIMAMTAESLHSKRDIACELAYRDMLITEFKEVHTELQAELTAQVEENINLTKKIIELEIDQENSEATTLPLLNRIKELEKWFNNYRTPEMAMDAMMKRIEELTKQAACHYDHTSLMNICTKCGWVR